MLHLVTNFLSLGGLVGIFCLTGWLADRILWRGRGLEPFAVVGWFGLGASMWIGWVFLLAAGQLLARSTFLLTAALVLVMAWRYRRLVAEGDRPVNRVDVGPRFDLSSRILAVLVGLTLVVLWLQAHWPVISWDANVYHLTVPKLYLENQGFYRIPFNVYSNWPLNAQLLFVVALVARDYLLAKALHFAFGVATLLLIVRAARTTDRVWAGWIGAVFFLINPVVLDEMRAAYVDLALAFFFLLAFVFMHRALGEEEARGRHLLLAGVFAGVASGIKPTGAMVILCLLIVYLVASLRQGRGPLAALAGSLKIAVPAGLLLVPWLVKSWILTGNPVYPFLFEWWGGPEWSLDLGAQFRAWQRGIGMGRSALDYLLLPYRVIVAGGSGYEHFDGRISPVWLGLVPLAAVFGRHRPLVMRSLGAAGIYFGLWALSSQQMRFLIPVLPLLSIAAAIALAEWAARLGEGIRPWFRSSVNLAAGATLLIVSGSILPPTVRMVGHFLTEADAGRTEFVHPVFLFIDEELPPAAKLLFLNTNHGFFCEREFIADSFFEASQINDRLRSRAGKEGVASVLRELEITHLLIENRDRSVPWPRALYDFLNDPERVRRVYRSPDRAYDVVEVLLGVPAPSGSL